MEDICEMRALIRGRVQGVGFRATARSYALRLGLKGTVRNLTDGRVEIYAQGSKKLLTDLMNLLKEEAFPGDIEDVSIHYFSIQSFYPDFRIVY